MRKVRMPIRDSNPKISNRGGSKHFDSNFFIKTQLHLKRFYYKENTFHKLKNKVIIPEVFGLPGFNDKYELYGNVVHYGSGTGRGGHYINYVKVAERWYRCDDEKVNFTKDPNEHLNPDAYLLFYKRQKIDRSWSFFGN